MQTKQKVTGSTFFSFSPSRYKDTEFSSLFYQKGHMGLRKGQGCVFQGGRDHVSHGALLARYGLPRLGCCEMLSQ